MEVIADSSVTRFSKDSNNAPDSDSNQALFDSVTTGGVEYDGAKKAFYSDEILDLYKTTTC